MVEKRESRHLQSERTIRCHYVSASSFRWGIRALFKERKKDVTAHTLSFSTSTHVKTFQSDTLALMWAGKLFRRLLVLCRKHSNHSIFSNRRPFEGLNHLTLMFYSGISLLHVWELMLGCSKDINHRFDSLIERKHASDGKKNMYTVKCGRSRGCAWNKTHTWHHRFGFLPKCRYDDAFSRVSGFLNISLAASEESHNKRRSLWYRCNRCPLAESLVSIYRGWV